MEGRFIRDVLDTRHSEYQTKALQRPKPSVCRVVVVDWTLIDNFLLERRRLMRMKKFQISVITEHTVISCELWRCEEKSTSRLTVPPMTPLCELPSIGCFDNISVCIKNANNVSFVGI